MSRLTGTTAAAIGALAAILLSGCAGDGESDAAAEPSTETLAALVSQADDLSTVATALEDAGLAQTFDGAAAYTLLAPRDAAFTGAGAAAALRAPEQRPAMVAVLRGHILPGYLTPADIARAIEADDDGKVAMKTMAGDTLTFARSDGAITAAGESGASVRLSGDALLASNGVAIPVDGLVVDLGGAE